MKKCPVQKCSLTADDLTVEIVIKPGRPRKWGDPDEFVAAINSWIRKRKNRMTWKYIRGTDWLNCPIPSHARTQCEMCVLWRVDHDFYSFYVRNRLNMSHRYSVFLERDR